MNSVSLTYRAEDECHGELAAKLRCGEFTGRGSAWFNVSELLEFARSTGTYPIEAGSELLLEGGAWKDDGTLDQIWLGIQIKPTGHQGALSVTVQLATSAISVDTSANIRAIFPVTYGDLASFQASLLSHINGHAEEATLEQSQT